MSKELIQQKISSFLSQPKSAEKKPEESSLKRKLSDSTAEGDMGDQATGCKQKSYAQVTGNGHRSADVSNKNTSYRSKDHQNNNSRPDKSNTTRSEGAAFTGQNQQSFGNDRKRSDSNPSPGIEEDSLHQVSRPKQGSSKDDDVCHTEYKRAVSRENTSSWRGVEIQELKRAPECFQKKDVSLPPLKPSSEHKIFFEVPSDGWNGMIPTPYGKYQDKWCDEHVYMPYSEQNKMPENGRVCSRKERIVQALTSHIYDSFELAKEIIAYNPHYKNRWNFDSLHQFFQENESDFFTKILPRMQDLAIRLPELCPMPIPILKQGRNMKLTFSQEQVACLLANAFFCTFPKRNFKSKHCKLPDINFSNLYGDLHDSRKLEKLSCIINYFRRVIEDMPKGTVTYARQTVPLEIDWRNMNKTFSKLHVSTTGTIEDDGLGMLQADFANKYVGGGVLGHGLVQEEIRFVICPEMILSRLFTQVLADNEVLIMTGCERFSNYTGYSNTFKYNGDHVDNTERDEWGRRCTEVVAMDALVFRGGFKTQFEKDKIFRELNKAYCAFSGNQFTENLPAVCTGNWGCGAFGGDKQLKAMIQWIAASAVDRDVCYFTFGDAILCDQLGQLHNLFKDVGVKIPDVLAFIKRYCGLLKNPGPVQQSLFQHIASMSGGKLEEPYIAEEISSQDVSQEVFLEMDQDDQ